MTEIKQRSSMNASRFSSYHGALIMLLTGLLALWAVTLSGMSYTPDSASYIDQSRSLLAGNGFASRPYGINNIEVSYEADRLFPPGYPIIIALGSAISGAPVEVVAPWINRFALMALPLIIFIAFKPIVGLYGAVCLGILGCLTPGFIEWGQYALTDVFSLTLVVTSFGCTLAAWSPHQLSRALLLAFGGGLIAGFAYLTRNGHLALLLATPLFMVIWFLVSPQMGKIRTRRVGLSWLLGVSLVVLPWLARNVMVFGKMQPYEMPPSTISILWNLKTFIAAQLSEVFGSQKLGNMIGMSIPGLVMLLVIAIAFVRLLPKLWPTLQSGEQRAFVFSIIYALFGAAIVIAARSKYQWGEYISDRHTLQYAIFIMLPISIVIRHLSVSKDVLIALLVGVIVALATFRFDSFLNAVEGSRWYALHENAVFNKIDEYRIKRTGPCAHDLKPIVVSNYAYLYRILCDANARHPGGGGMGSKSTSDAMALVQSSVGNRPVIAVFHPGRGIEASNMPLSESGLEALVAQGWMMKENAPLALVLVKNMPSPTNQ